MGKSLWEKKQETAEEDEATCGSQGQCDSLWLFMMCLNDFVLLIIFSDNSWLLELKHPDLGS